MLHALRPGPAYVYTCRTECVVWQESHLLWFFSTHSVRLPLPPPRPGASAHALELAPAGARQPANARLPLPLPRLGAFGYALRKAELAVGVGTFMMSPPLPSPPSSRPWASTESVASCSECCLAKRTRIYYFDTPHTLPNFGTLHTPPLCLPNVGKLITPHVHSLRATCVPSVRAVPFLYHGTCTARSASTCDITRIPIHECVAPSKAHS